MADRNLTWRDEQKAAFGRRLKAARKAMKGPDGKPLYKTTADFISALKARQPNMQVRIYYHYEAGGRVPRDDATINLFAEMLNTSRNWLLFGSEEDVNEDSLSEDDAEVNQVIETSQTKPLKPPLLRYIPVLSASDIKTLLLGNGNLTTMSREQLPVPQHVDAGADPFYYRIPDDDTSMVGRAGHSFPPGTVLLINRERTVRPGDFLLAQLGDAPAPVMRRLQSAMPIAPSEPRYPFKLVALNPMAEPITVDADSDCEILGRVVSFTQIL